MDWPRVESLLPPQLHEALGAAHAGEYRRALDLCKGVDARDALAAEAVEFVRGLSDLASDHETRGLSTLMRVARGHDVALAMAASIALAERDVEARRFAAARHRLQPMRRRVHQPADTLGLETTFLWVELQRRGPLDPTWLEKLAGRLARHDPAGLHARVHLLRAESALLSGELPAAVALHREVGPYVRAARSATLRLRYDNLTRHLRTPFADIEDWEQPLRPVSREDVAEVESGAWSLWIDALHRRVRQRDGDRVRTLGFARQARAWQTLEALVRTPRRRLSWAQAVSALGLEDAAEARERSAQLSSYGAGFQLLESDSGGFQLPECRYVLLYPTQSLPAPETRLLAQLAMQPGTRAAQLAEDDLARRTVVRHLSRLRRQGFLRMVGGGNEACYYLV